MVIVMRRQNKFLSILNDNQITTIKNSLNKGGRK